jgi:alkanesulfonate monooxygenase SsuD/methylene tetrahydromethanopterin reductase-like flavin-dependent oxidoreductase (luciferase family)
MADVRFGFVAFLMEQGEDGPPRWTDVTVWADLAEQAGFDTFWIPDELLWEDPEAGTASGWWECVAFAGAVAAATSKIDVGTWVMSALHRNPALTARVAETLDEISGGRFILGLGAGHSGRQGEAFGYPPDRVVSRYEEALAIILPMLREGQADFQGDHHRAVRVASRPRGPSEGRVEIMLAGHGPRTMRLAARYADVWSGYGTTSSQPDAFTGMLAQLGEACADVGRDPATLGRSIGVAVSAPGLEPGPLIANDNPITGSRDDIVRSLRELIAMGATSIEFYTDNDPRKAIPAWASVIEEVRRS